MTDYEQVERSMDAGLHPGVGEAGDQLRNQIPATLAHELRSPLASIPIALQSMRHSHVEEVTARQARDRAERQALHMARIIEK